jgi:hypothetical protein
MERSVSERKLTRSKIFSTALEEAAATAANTYNASDAANAANAPDKAKVDKREEATKATDVPISAPLILLRRQRIEAFKLHSRAAEIQCVWRGKLARKKYKELMADLREKQKQQQQQQQQQQQAEQVAGPQPAAIHKM